MAVLNGNTIVVNPETGAGVVLLAGDEVPDWAESLIGDHLVDDSSAAYESMKVAELKAEIDKRNDGREDDALLPVEGKKDDLVAVLEADDESA
jgi:hypothetical protein